jgi:NIMA (never in mitosis gene a)-related kinase 8
MKKKKTFRNDEAMRYFTMILIALHYLHSKNIVHRDLKPANILIDELPGKLNILKIGDFGISKVDLKELKKTVTSTMGGQTSPAYMAPEVITNESITSKVDMWALGIILFQLVSSYNHPFPCDNVFAMAIAIKDNEPALASLPPSVSPFIKDTIKALLEKNPKARPDAQTLIDKDEIKL